MEINGLSALWKMMLGKRWNVLKSNILIPNFVHIRHENMIILICICFFYKIELSRITTITVNCIWAPCSLPPCYFFSPQF